MARSCVFRVALRDVHQPLHAGYADDRGGNKYHVRVFGRGTNLHALWDTGLIQTGPGHGDLNAGCFQRQRKQVT